MSKIAAVCQCGKPPACGVAVIAYALPWRKPGKAKTSRVFHLCSDCIIRVQESVKGQLATALRSSYGAIAGNE